MIQMCAIFIDVIIYFVLNFFGAEFVCPLISRCYLFVHNYHNSGIEGV